MPILTSGSNVTLTVAAGQILTVQSDQATFDFENPVGTRVGEYACDSVFGPFVSAGSVKITSVQGPVYYELASRPVGQSVPFDPSSVAITGGTINGAPVANFPFMYTGVVATKCRIPNSLDATNKQALGQRSHTAMETLLSGAWNIAVPNFYTNTSTGEAGSGAVMSVNAAIEYPKGTTTRVTFSGSSTGSIPDNTYLVSDGIPLAIPQGARFWVRLFLQSAGGIPLQQAVDGQMDSTATGDNTQKAVSGLSDVTMTPGAVTNTTNGFGIGVCAIIGLTSRPTVFGLGDSIVQGVSDSGFEQPSYYFDVSTDGALGYMERSLITKCAYIMAGTSGEKATSLVAGGTAYTANRVALSAYCKYLFGEFGINDLLNSRSAAQLSSDVTAIATRFGLPTYWMTLTPYANVSTDAWTTYGNQTPSAWTAQRTTFNTSLRLGQVSAISGCFDVAKLVEYGKNTNRWRTNGRVVADGAITSGTATLTSATAAFTPDDIGKQVSVAGAGAASGPLLTFISDYASATSVTVFSNASTTVTGAVTRVGSNSYTQDGVHPYLTGIQVIQDALTVHVSKFLLSLARR